MNLEQMSRSLRPSYSCAYRGPFVSFVRDLARFPYVDPAHFTRHAAASRCSYKMRFYHDFNIAVERNEEAQQAFDEKMREFGALLMGKWNCFVPGRCLAFIGSALSP
jgi:hypothetical protein